jgi:hypothetical protein
MIKPSKSDKSLKEAAKRSGGLSTRRRVRRRSLLACSIWVAAIALTASACAGWLAFRAASIKSDLESASQLIPAIKASIADNKSQEASASAEKLRSHTAAAREAAGDPLWTLAAAVPGIGANFSAVAEIARSADDVSTLGVAPLVKVFSSLNWDSLLPSSAGSNLAPLRKASPSVTAAAHAVRESSARLEKIDSNALLPQISGPLTQVRGQLQAVTGALDAAADMAQVAPEMLGAEGPRNYLLMIQNNAEVRASGGIPGALAELTLDKGRLTLGTQSTAGDIGVMSPALPVDVEQQRIYSGRLGKFMQDVNLTPDFPTTASIAQLMWERKTGKRVDGVISMDPVALGYILDATGSVQLGSSDLTDLASSGLPTELTGKNVVRTLLSDVYAKIDQPRLQDVYFAGVAKEIFAALSSGAGNAKTLSEGISRGTEEGRVLVWAAKISEQAVIAKYPLSGAIAGASISPAQFGVYFNDGTGAKMDYYVHRTVQLIEECPADGYGEVKVRVTSTNTAPKDAATSLPEYVTGGGVFGVPAGSVQTNITAYGPVQSNVETAVVAGKKTGFASQHHAGRPVGTVTVQLTPGQSQTVEFTFGKIVQHTDPQLFVTPTVQAEKDVTLATQAAECVPAS